jgi:hypothetical protein
MAEEFGIAFLGRAPIDPNLVLAIERNQGNSTGTENGDGPVGTTIVDAYRQLALHDVFKGIVEKLVDTEGERMQN